MSHCTTKSVSSSSLSQPVALVVPGWAWWAIVSCAIRLLGGQEVWILSIAQVSNQREAYAEPLLGHASLSSGERRGDLQPAIQCNDLMSLAGDRQLPYPRSTRVERSLNKRRRTLIRDRPGVHKVSYFIPRHGSCSFYVCTTLITTIHLLIVFILIVIVLHLDLSRCINSLDRGVHIPATSSTHSTLGPCSRPVQPLTLFIITIIIINTSNLSQQPALLISLSPSIPTV